MTYISFIDGVNLRVGILNKVKTVWTRELARPNLGHVVMLTQPREM